MKNLLHVGVVLSGILALSACQGNKKAETKASAEQGKPVANKAPATQARPQARPRPVEVRPSPSTGQHAKSSWTMNFDQANPGALLPNLEGRTGKWTIAKDDQAKSGKNVVAQLASNEDSFFNVLLVKNQKYKDMRISVWLKAIEGKVDQGGGPVWRAKDEKNYYVARYNPLEDNLRLYYVKDGRRKMLTGTSLRVDHKAWHQMVVTMVGDHITVSMDGKKWLDFHDKTFTDAGLVGLWTKSDARTHFDDLSVAFMAPAAAGSGAAAPAGSAAAARKPTAARKSTATRKSTAVRKPAPARK